jgi:mannitol/fructose-specific phosphotransferase system IIA component (Ntr-type)
MYSSSTASVSALSLHSLLVREHILIGLCATSKKRVFEEIGFLFEKTAKLNRQLITDSLFARERLGSTGLGHGVAIPHGRIKGLKEPQLAFVQLESPIGPRQCDVHSFGAGKCNPKAFGLTLRNCLVDESRIQ